jgi:predicted nucleic acid-binding protein
MASSHRLRVFLDANVWFSGIYSPRGTPGLLLEAAVTGVLTPVTSEQLLGEVVRNLRAKAPAGLARFLEIFPAAQIEVVPNPSSAETDVWDALGLSEDAHVVAAAVEAEVDYLCTGDAGIHQRLSAVPGAPRLLTSRDLLDLLAL